MDLINREQALKALEEISYALWEVDIPSPTVPEYIEHHRDIQKVMGIADMWARKIMAFPSAEKTGKWIDDKVAFYLKCSECGCCVRANSGEVFLDYARKWKYCPNCGTRMVD